MRVGFVRVRGIGRIQNVRNGVYIVSKEQVE